MSTKRKHLEVVPADGYLSADDLIARSVETDKVWEARMDYDLVQDILSRFVSLEEWGEMRDILDDVVFDTIMSFAEEDIEFF